jgi:hypothetical protein
MISEAIEQPMNLRDLVRHPPGRTHRLQFAGVEGALPQPGGKQNLLLAESNRLQGLEGPDAERNDTAAFACEVRRSPVPPPLDTEIRGLLLKRLPYEPARALYWSPRVSYSTVLDRNDLKFYDKLLFFITGFGELCAESAAGLRRSSTKECEESPVMELGFTAT